MITASAIVAFLLKNGSDILDFLKKHWRITLEIGGIVWIVICCLTHFGSPDRPFPNRVSFKPIPIIAPDVPSPILHTLPVNTEPIWSVLDISTPLSSADGSRDSISYLLQITDYLQTQLYGCDSTYRTDTDLREYTDEFATDSFRLGYTFYTRGYMDRPPTFSILPTFSPQVQVTIPRGIYLEGAIGPILSYGDPIRLQAIRGEVGLGVFNRKGWSYGLKAGASQLGWDVQASFRRSFQVRTRKKR